MPYVGTSLVNNFQAAIRDNFTGDGSATDFTLSRNATSVNDIEVFVGNVRQQPAVAYTVSGSTLAFTGTPANGEVIYVIHQAGALQTVKADPDFGSRNFLITGNISMTKDSAVLSMGVDSDVTITHDPDDGLFIKSAATADDNPMVLTLQTGETDLAANDVIGQINFQAPDEGTGTDAILISAGISAIAEGDHSSTSNATKLSFQTGASEAATEKMSLSSGGNLTLSGDMTIGGDLDVTGTVSFSENNITDVGIISLDTIRGDTDTNTSIVFSGSDVITISTGGSPAVTIAASQIVTFADDIIMKAGGTIGGANDTDLLTLGSAILTVAGEVSMTTLDIGGTNVTSTAAELNILDGVTSTAAELNLLDGGTSSSSITLADADGFFVNDGGASKLIPASDIKTYIGSSTAADDLTVGDAAILLTTSSGNITIDAAASDSDIIFKGTDGGSDKVFATFDGSAGGDLFLNGGLIDLKNDGSNVSQIKFYCESSNAHAQTLIGAPHAETGTNTLTLPSSGGDSKLLSATSTATVTNKTLTSPKINENVALTSTATELNFNDGVTLGTAIASKIVTTDGNIDSTGMRNLTISGELDAATLDISGAIDVAGTSNLDVVDIDGAVDMASTLAVTGIATFTDDIIIGDGKTIGSASDVDAITIASNGQLTLTQTLIGTALDISGDIDVDGTTNLDIVDIDGAVNMATTLLVTGETTLQTHLNMGDGDIIKLGASADLTLKHDGSNSYISDTGTGTLIIEGSQIAIKKNGVDETMALFTPDAAATLYHNNAAKIATTATGVNVTGAVNIGGTGTANALDDYEEGSWTPSVGGNANYTQQFGRYTKIGNHITLQCVIIIGNAIGTGSASSLSGLPFAQESTGFSVGSLSISYMGANATSVIYPTGYVINNAATISFSGMNGANTTFQLNGFNMFTNTTHLQFSVSYRTA